MIGAKWLGQQARGTKVRVAIGADHAGFPLKQALQEGLGDEGHHLLDLGTNSGEPVDYPDQPNFLNAVCLARTDALPHQVLAWCKEIESALGREPAPRYGPRMIDLDILLYGDERIETPDLTIPHPRMSERAFVQVPLAELNQEQTDAAGVKAIESPGWWR